MTKKAEAMETDDLLKQPAKQSYAKIAKNNKKNQRTWVVIYRLVDGPPVDMEKVKRAAKERKKREREKAKEQA